jgi:hypothetical protein
MKNQPGLNCAFTMSVKISDRKRKSLIIFFLTFLLIALQSYKNNVLLKKTTLVKWNFTVPKKIFVHVAWIRISE